MSIDDAVSAFYKAVLRNSSHPGLSDLDEVAALIRSVEYPENDTPVLPETMSQLIVAVAWFHWNRYSTSPSDRKGDFFAAMALFAAIQKFAPKFVPREVRQPAKTFNRTPGSGPSKPGYIASLWDTMTAELRESNESLRDIIFLRERAAAAVPDNEPARAGYLFDLAALLYDQAVAAGDIAQLRRAGEELDTGFELHAGRDPHRLMLRLDTPDTRPAHLVALRAAIDYRLFQLTDEESLLESAVLRYKEVLKSLSAQHIDYPAHRLNYPAALTDLYIRKQQQAAGDAALAEVAWMRRRSARDRNMTTLADDLHRKIIRSRFPVTGVDLGPVQQPHPPLPWRDPQDHRTGLQRRLADFEKAHSPASLKLSRREHEALREGPLTLGWWHWYRFITSPGSAHSRSDLDAALGCLETIPAEHLPGAVRILRDSSMPGLELVQAFAAVELQVPEQGWLKPAIVGQLQRWVKGSRADAAAKSILTGYLGIGLDWMFHAGAGQNYLDQAHECLTTAIADVAIPEGIRGAFRSALAGVLADSLAFNEAITCARLSTDDPPTPDSPLTERWYKLGQLLMQRHSISGDLADAEAAFDALSQAHVVASTETERLATLRELVEWLIHFGYRRGDVAWATQRLAGLDPSNPQYLPLHGVAGLLMARPLIDDGEGDLDDVIRSLRTAADGIPESCHDDNFGVESTLGMMLMRRYGRRRDLADANRAMLAYTRIATTSRAHALHPMALMRMGMLAHLQCASGRRRDLMRAAIEFLYHAEEIAPQEQQWMIDEQLALALTEQYGVTGRLEILDEAIERTRRCAAEVPEADERLAELLLKRRRHSGDGTDADVPDPEAAGGGDQMDYETLVSAVLNGAMTIEQAERRIAADFTSEQLTALLDRLPELADIRSSQEDLLRRRLLHAAARDIGPADPRAPIKIRACLELLAGLQRAADEGPQVFDVGRDAGRWLLGYAASTSDQWLKAETNLRVASMWSQLLMLRNDAYWRQRQYARTRTTDGWDEPQDIAQRAVDTARQAVELSTGWQLSQALRRLSLALRELRDMGGEIFETELFDVTRRAMADLGPQHFLAYAELLQGLPPPERLTQASRIAEWLQQDYSEVVDQYGNDALTRTTVHTAKALLDIDPEAGRRLIESIRSRMPDDASVDPTKLLWLEAALAAAVSHWQPSSGNPITLELVTAATSGSHPDDPVAFARWISHTPIAPGEEKDVVSKALAVLEGHDETGVVIYLRTTLKELLISSLPQEGRAAIAVDIARGYLRLGAKARSILALERLAHAVRYIDGGDATAVLMELGWILRASHAPEDQRPLHAVYAGLLGRILETGVLDDTPLALLAGQVKGARLGEQLAIGPRQFTLDSGMLDMLSRIQIAAASTSWHPSDPRIDDLMLMAWANELQHRPADSAAERLLNMQREFDRRIQALTLTDRTPHPFNFVNLLFYHQALDDRTVLVIYLHLINSQGKPGIAQLTIAQGSIMIAFGSDEDAAGDAMIVGDIAFTMSEFGYDVAHARSTIQKDPGVDVLCDDAAATMADGPPRRLLLGSSGRETLRRHRAEGKDRLLIVPWGPFHYYPLHLAGLPDEPILDGWNVAYLPNIKLFDRQLDVVRRSRTIASLALSYNGHPTRPPLPKAIQEAQDCAGVFGSEAIVESRVTKAALLNALRTSRYVHLAAHGTHNADAPSFQTLHLAPSGEDDGRVYMYELLQQDFTGIELVTLSACETALGRVDRLDNVLGIPTALLLAGVPAIIATMWPVYDAVAAHFFPILYQQLAAQNDVWDAFRTAQTETRMVYPQYRDWGAFVLMGVPFDARD